MDVSSVFNDQIPTLRIAETERQLGVPKLKMTTHLYIYTFYTHMCQELGYCKF